jgi:hypothetical protein
MNSCFIHGIIHKFILYKNSCFIQSHLPIHLVFEFEVTPIPFLMELFIDSTGEVFKASKDMAMFLHTKNARYCSLSVMEHLNFSIALIQSLFNTSQHKGDDNISVNIICNLLY